MTVVYVVNGVTLPGERGAMFATELTTWRPEELPVARNAMVLPGIHGTKEVGLPVMGEPIVRLVARFTYPTLADLETHVNRWIALLTQPTLTLGRSSGGLWTTFAGRLITISNDSFTRVNDGWSARVTAGIAIPGAFMREDPQTEPDIASSGDLTNVEITTLAGSTAPVIDAVLRFTGPWLNPSATNPTTGTGVSWSGMVDAGKYLFLTSHPLSGRLSASAGDWAAGGSDVSGQVSFPSSGRLQLWPVVAGTLDNPCRVYVSTTGSSRVAGQTKFAVRASRSHL